MSREKTRLVLPDVLKGLAVVLMIQVHVMEQLGNPDLFESTLGKYHCSWEEFLLPLFSWLSWDTLWALQKPNPLRMMKRGVLLFGGGILLNILLNVSYIIGFIKTGYPDSIPAVFLELTYCHWPASL